MDLASPANPKIKYVVKLRSCSVREESGEMIVEGFRECRRALDNGYRPHAIFHCPDLWLKNENEAALVADCVKRGAEEFSCSKAAFLKMAYKDRPDGLLMVGPHVTRRLSDLDLPSNALVIVTESIEKPGNLGTILRSADAAKASAVIVCDRTTDSTTRTSCAPHGNDVLVPMSSDQRGGLAWLKARLKSSPPRRTPGTPLRVDLTGNVRAAWARAVRPTAKWMNAASRAHYRCGGSMSLNGAPRRRSRYSRAAAQCGGIDKVPAFERAREGKHITEDNRVNDPSSRGATWHTRDKRNQTRTGVAQGGARRHGRGPSFDRVPDCLNEGAGEDGPGAPEGLRRVSVARQGVPERGKLVHVSGKRIRRRRCGRGVWLLHGARLARLRSIVEPQECPRPEKKG